MLALSSTGGQDVITHSLPCLYLSALYVVLSLLVTQLWAMIKTVGTACHHSAYTVEGKCVAIISGWVKF